MALMETKIIQVNNDPYIINATNEEWGKFGWNVLNVQVTHSQDTKTYTKGWLDYYTGDKTVETTTINYATITYQRDKNMPNYARISALEQQYIELLNERGFAESRKEGRWKQVLRDIKPIQYVIFLALMVVLSPVGLVYAVITVSKLLKQPDSSTTNDAISEQVRGIEQKMSAIVDEADRLMSAV